MDFIGAKLAILVKNRIVTILRDNVPSIPWPGHWDLPGFVRDGDETPQDCVLRELQEELGLTLRPNALAYGVPSRSAREKVRYFVTEQGDFDPGQVRFGDEGQGWKLAEIDWYLRQPKAIPHHVRELICYLETR